MPFVEHFFFFKKGISCPSVWRPVPPIRHSGLSGFPKARTYSNHMTDLDFFGA